jgi:hypothetical protein
VVQRFLVVLVRSKGNQVLMANRDKRVHGSKRGRALGSMVHGSRDLKGLHMQDRVLCSQDNRVRRRLDNRRDSEPVLRVALLAPVVLLAVRSKGPVVRKQEQETQRCAC